MVTMTTGGKPRKQKTKDEQITELKKLCSLIEEDNIKLREQVKNLTIPRVINWVSCSEHEPDTEDTYYVYPDKYHYTAEYHKYGKWAGKWTVDDQNGYEYEVHVDYWKVIEPPCL